jgi:hypothetical protein
MADTARMPGTDGHHDGTHGPGPAHADDSDGSDGAPGPAGSHGAGHGHDAASEPLGPVDVAAWGYALAGGAVGLLVALALYVASAA